MINCSHWLAQKHYKSYKEIISTMKNIMQMIYTILHTGYC